MLDNEANKQKASEISLFKFKSEKCGNFTVFGLKVTLKYSTNFILTIFVLGLLACLVAYIRPQLDLYLGPPAPLSAALPAVLSHHISSVRNDVTWYSKLRRNARLPHDHLNKAKR